MDEIVFLTEREAADFLSRSANTLRDWRANNQGPPYLKLETGSVLYEQADLVAWARLQKINPREDVA